MNKVAQDDDRRGRYGLADCTSRGGWELVVIESGREKGESEFYEELRSVQVGLEVGHLVTRSDRESRSPYD